MQLKPSLLSASFHKLQNSLVVKSKRCEVDDGVEMEKDAAELSIGPLQESEILLPIVIGVLVISLDRRVDTVLLLTLVFPL